RLVGERRSVLGVDEGWSEANSEGQPTVECDADKFCDDPMVNKINRTTDGHVERETVTPILMETEEAKGEGSEKVGDEGDSLHNEEIDPNSLLSTSLVALEESGRECQGFSLQSEDLVQEVVDSPLLLCEEEGGPGGVCVDSGGTCDNVNLEGQNRDLIKGKEVVV
ncbi:hypothetical protein A2U01_0050439, partial [Trifolium medium]|nr:hypothetical protein [Trifolium medium]